MSFEDALILVAKVEEFLADQKPCYVTTQGRYGGSYRRTGEGDTKLIDYEVDRLIEEKTQPQWDDSVITEASLTDLDHTALSNFLESEKPNAHAPLHKAKKPPCSVYGYCARETPL